MKIKKVLFLSLFLILGLLLCMPNRVNAAEELNKIEIEMTELEEGKIVPAYAKVTLSNDSEAKLVYENIELSWKVYDSEGDFNSLNITNNTVFEKDTKYGFDFKEDSWEMTKNDWENKGYTFTDSTEWYVNGSLIEKEGSFSFDWEFWINGVESADVIVDVPIVGQQLPKTVKYIFKTSTETKEIVVNCYWINGSDGEVVAEDDVTESGVVYIPGVSYADNSDEYGLYMDKTDFRTKLYINGELIDLANDTLGIKAQEKENSSEVPPTSEGEGQEEIQPDNNDNNTENTNTDVNDNNTGNTSTDANNNNTLNGNNPQTGDNIMLFVAILGIATIGMVATTRLKKD